MEGTFVESIDPKVVAGGESAGQFDEAFHYVRDVTHARCATVIVIDREAGSGYSVVGPLGAQVLMPDILQ
jgi:hypothetical protein